MTTDVIGRDQEIERLRAFLDTSGLDEPRALILDGEAGIGKSTIWRHGLERAQERGWRILSSRPAEAEQDLPFAGLGDLFEGCLGDVLPALARPRRHALEVALLVEEAHDPVDPRAVGVAVRSALEVLAGGLPLLLAVDDVQWLDRSSAHALAFALRRTGAPLHVLLTLRGGEGRVTSAVETALMEMSLERVPVGPLSVGALQTVIRERLDRVFPRPKLLRIHETSGGNPFYALEIARVLPLEFDASQPLPVPETLESLVRARIEGLPDASRRALVLLSAIGDADTATLRSANVEDAFEGAIARGIVERAADRLRFTHPLLASSVYQNADESTRRACHAVLAEIVGDRIERAWHKALSMQAPDPQIAAAVDEAADLALAQGATAGAVPLRRHALRLTPPEAADDAHRRTIALVRARDAAGESVSSLEPLARDVLDRAAPGVPRAQALLLSAYLAHDIETKVALHRRAVDEARDDPALQARIHVLLAWDVRIAEGLEASDHHARACLAIADRLRDDALRAAGLVALSTVRFHMAKPDAVRLGARGRELACSVADPEQLLRDTLTLSNTLIWSFELDRARALLEPVYRDWSVRDESVAGETLWRFACIEMLAGRLGAAEDFAERSLEIGEAYGAIQVALLWAVAQIAAWRGDLDRARSVIERATVSPDLTPWLVPRVETVLGQVALWTGNAGSAIEHFSRAEDLRAVGSLEPNLALWRADYAEALVQVGRTEEAVSLLDTWEAEAARLNRRVVLAQVTRCRGLVAAAGDDVAAARTLLERAVDEHDAVGDPLGRARAFLALGVVRRRARQRRDARRAIEEAAAIFDDCGANGWAERARGELGRVSGRKREENLTAAEQRVAALVVEGRTNREVAAALFLGERTVETHLTHIYAKLGVRSRTELARVYRPAS